MDGQNLLDSFQLNDDTVIDEHIQPQAGIQEQVVVDDRQGQLPRSFQSSSFNFMRQTDLVNTFEQTWP